MTLKPMSGLLTAFRTLTIFSWPGKEDTNLASSLPWFPVVGFVLGLTLYLITSIWVKIPFELWPSGGALLIVGVQIWMTRGLHQDGLADWADSLGGFFDREKRLEIMKDSNVGAFGVLALILLLAAKWVAFERMISSGSITWLLAVLVISRDMMVELITTLKYARNGNGMGRDFVKGASLRHRILSHIITIFFSLFYGPFGLVLWLLAFMTTGLLKRRFKKGFGGVTGDLMGAANEAVEVILLFLCSLPGKEILCFTGWEWI
jgi:adenosylcobinamide-GDP ribazoletransferase